MKAQFLWLIQRESTSEGIGIEEERMLWWITEMIQVQEPPDYQDCCSRRSGGMVRAIAGVIRFLKSSWFRCVIALATALSRDSLGSQLGDTRFAINGIARKTSFGVCIEARSSAICEN